MPLFKELADTIHVSLAETCCVGCGKRQLGGDYLCGRCSALKAKNEQHFWVLALSRPLLRPKKAAKVKGTARKSGETL